MTILFYFSKYNINCQNNCIFPNRIQIQASIDKTVIILNFTVGGVIILCKKQLATLQKSNTVFPKDITVVIINMVTDVGQVTLCITYTTSFSFTYNVLQ